MNQATAQSHPSQDNGQAKYFDLHTDGLGYLNRIRVVPVRKGDAYLCCAIAALRGAAEAPEYTYFDLKVSGAAAKRAVEMLRTAVDNDQKVLIGFKAGDTYPEVFIYENGPKKGQTGVSTKGRLLQVRWVRIDGMPIDLPSDEPKTDDGAEAVEIRSEAPTPEREAESTQAANSPGAAANTQASQRREIAAFGLHR